MAVRAWRLLLVAAVAVGVWAGTLCGRADAWETLPMRLPPFAAHQASSLPPTWLLGVRPGARLARISKTLAARRVTDSAYVVGTDRARAAAAALRAAGELTYAEPDIRLRRASAPDGHPEQWARAAVVSPALAAPAFGGVKIGIVDDLVDPTVPDVGPQTRYLNRVGQLPSNPHGTMVASVAAAAAGNGGVMGIFPGAPLVGYATNLRCSDVARGVDRLVDAGVSVINLSLGSPHACATLYAAIEYAIGAGVVVVAAAGNEYDEGNPVEYPAAFPHVLSVASVDPDLNSSAFSDANAAIDLSAPGEQVPVAIPPRFDTDDGAQDGVTLADGTSFAAPMAAGAAAWVAAARPRLSAGQVADTLRDGADDLASRGWDRDTGWGLVDIQRALSDPAPPLDPLEPNDDIPFIDGTFFGRADPYVYRGHGSRRLGATVDYAEDPFDVYRIRMSKHSALRATVSPYYGDPDLYAFDGAARTISRSRDLITRSAHYHGRERIGLINTSQHTITGYLVVNASRSRGTIDAGYTLTVTRTRYRP